MSSLGEAVAWAVDAAAEKVRETFGWEHARYTRPNGPGRARNLRLLR